MTKKTQIQPLPDINAAKPFVEQHPILISCRVRLNEEQRDTLKKAVRSLERDLTPAAATPLPGSTVKSTSTFDPISSALGINRFVIAEILGSRESISLITLVNLQHALNVTVISEQDIIDAATGYARYVFGYNNASK